MSWPKRLLDLALATVVGLVLALPFAVLVGVLLFTSGRPIFYRSERMKAPGQPFTLWKLRTMTTVAGDAGVSGGDKAGRITRAGRFLRRTRADEIPQLWNVLRGDMSMVGPRPPLRIYVERFPDLYARVLRSRPGVTGLATLTYHRHEEWILARCRTPEETDHAYAARCVPAKARIDLIYQRHHSICLDLAILAKTVRRAATRRATG